MIPLSDYYRTISQPAHNGLVTPGLLYPGFDKTTNSNVPPGQALWLPMQTDSIVSCRIAAPVAVAAIHCSTQNNNIHGTNAIASIIENTLEALAADQLDYDSQPIKERLRGIGVSYESLTFYQINPLAEQSVVWRAASELILMLIFSTKADALIRGDVTGYVNVEYRATTLTKPILPPPLGEVLDEFTIPRGTARSYEIPKDHYVQIIDIEGRQCSDFMAFNTRALEAGLERHIDNTVSRTFTMGAYPRPGLLNKFFDNDIVPLLEIVQDTVGRHDTFALACTAKGYEDRGFPGHINCSDNISNAVDKYGIKPRAAWPAINFFFNSWIDSSQNTLHSDEAWSRSGDYVLMQALTDLVAVSTACPDDIDPINGWNPTDIHVRLYKPTASITPAIAYRVKPNELPNMTTKSPLHTCTSKLTSKYQPYLDYWVPQYFEPYGTLTEYWACREKATIQDMSNLRIYDICGIDAQAFLQKIITKDVNRISINKGTYALVCDDSGSVLDDGTLFHLGPHLYRWTCTTGESRLHMEKIAQENNFHVFIRDMSKTLCTISIQGRKSRDILKDIVFIQPTQTQFTHLSWFGGSVARLEDHLGIPVYISRTGYTGELGYELFCNSQQAIAVWETVTSKGGKDIIPMGAEALGIIRVEAGLMAFRHEFGHMQDPYEAGLGFAVDTNKVDFIGCQALKRNFAAPRRKLVGLILVGNAVPHHDDGIFKGRTRIGTITSAVYSPLLQKVIAMAVINVEYADIDNEVEIGQLDGFAKRLSARVTAIPFVDPQRKRVRGIYE